MTFYSRYHNISLIYPIASMRVTVTTIDGTADVLNLEITSDLCIKDLKAVIESESTFGIKATDMSLFHDG